MGDGISGFGSTLSGSTSGSIAQILSVSMPSQEVDDLDITTMASNNGFKEYTPGLKDAGEITLQLLYEKANCNTIDGLLGGTAEVWTITLPDGSTWACSGYFKSLGGESPHGAEITQSATIKLTGAPTFTAA